MGARKHRKEGLSMRMIREILRLSLEQKHCNREISRICGTSHTAVNKHVKRAEELGLSWEAVLPMTDDELTVKFYSGDGVVLVKIEHMPDWAMVNDELKKKHVTRQLLWEEYRQDHPEGYALSQFCFHYRRWVASQSLVFRNDHKAGEKTFVDYAGDTVDIVCPKTGEIRKAQIFVAVLGASNYAYAEATWTQTLPDWIGSHVRAFKYFGGVTEIVVPDNLRSGISRCCRYEPESNPTYHDWSVHHNVAIIPARARKPRDKAKAEVGVLFVERWILARLRNRTFFSLAELNETISELLEDLNNRPFKKLDGCRRTRFEALDKPALRPLPATHYEFAEWKQATVNIDYHIEMDGHYYSVPNRYYSKKMHVRYTATVVEIFLQGERIVSHPRSYIKGNHTTLSEHMPPQHKAYCEWTPERMAAWAHKIGTGTEQLIKGIIERRPHPEQGYRSSLGILRLGKKYGDDRLEAACCRALSAQAFSYKTIRTILEKGLDRQLTLMQKPILQTNTHENIRGAEYFCPTTNNHE